MLNLLDLPCPHDANEQPNSSPNIQKRQGYRDVVFWVWIRLGLQNLESLGISYIYLQGLNELAGELLSHTIVKFGRWRLLETVWG